MEFMHARFAKNGYEVSSAGDRRFSAFFARMPDGRTIEEHYQCDVKGYDVGGRNWRLGKGRPPKWEMSREALFAEYKALWKVWLEKNPGAASFLVDLAADAGGRITLTDRFATGEVNQARALAELMNERNGA